jgi:hypothetical protein
MKLETRIFTCFILTLILIFLTGCHSVKWQWFPPKGNPHLAPEPPFSIKGTKMDAPTPQGVTVLQGSF